MTHHEYIHQFAIAYMPAIYKRVIELLDGRELSLAQISKELHCVVETAREAVVKLRRSKIVRIAAWKRGISGPPMPIYTLGTDKDAPRPPKKSHSDRSRDWRIKKNAAMKAQSSMWGAIL